MINRTNFFFIFLILSLTFVKSIVAEEFIFDSEEILILEEGNLLDAPKGGKVTSNNNLTIYADNFKYNKISSVLTATGNVIVIDNDNNTETKSKKITYLKNEELITAEGNVSIFDIKKNILLDADKTIYHKKNDIFKAFSNVIVQDKSNQIILETDELIYERKKEKISSIDSTKINVEDNYTINSSNIIFLRKENKVYSYEPTNLQDKDNYYYSAENFRYFLNTKIFRGKNLYVLTEEKDKYYFTDGIIDLISKEIVGKDLVTYFNKKYSDDENEPRLKGNTGYSDEDKTLIKKGAFTTCKSRGDKCPPWIIEAKEVKHDKKKKIVFYKNAWLKVYDIPVLYYPRFFHPDPTVERQSGFLKPSISDSQNLGVSVYLPYFYVLSESQDLTIKPRFYEDDKTILQTEYRNVSKNTSSIMDVSYTSGHKSYKQDDKDSRGHFFAKSTINLDIDQYESSNININLEKTTNDTYLKLFKLESPLLYDRDLGTLNSKIVFNANKKDLNLRSSVSVYEKLNLGNSDRYEFIFPDFSLSKNIDTLNYPGFLEFNSNGSSRVFETNKSETKLINDLIYYSDISILESGIKNDYNLLFKNFNSLGNNSTNFESSLDNKFLTTFLYKSSYPLKKEGKSYNNYLTPKLIFRFSPNGMSQKINNGLDISNIFSNNRIGTNDTFESGESITLGIDFDKEKKSNESKILTTQLGTIFRLDKEEYLGTDNSMSNKQTDVVGKINFNPFTGNFINYKFSMNDDLDTFNSHSISTKISVNNFVTKFDYIEDFVGNASKHSLKNETSYKFNDNGSFGFSTSRNKKINFTEFYNTFYQYKNDCLTARIVYNKSYYEDRDIKPSENLFFSVTIVPLGAYQSQDILGFKGF